MEIIFKKHFERETQAGDVAQRVKACLACTRPWGPAPALQKLSMAALACKPSSWEVEAGSARVPARLCLHTEFKISLRFS